MASLDKIPGEAEIIQHPPAPDTNCNLLESDSTWEDPVTLVPHGDHFDRLITRNPWEKPGKSEEDVLIWERGWPIHPWGNGDESTNSSFDDNPDSQAMIKKMVSLSRDKDLGDLLLGLAIIPLFDAGNGYEYQLHVYQDTEWTLPDCWCPERLEGTAYNAHSYISELTPRSLMNQASGNKKPGVPVPIPRFVWPIGGLSVRTKSRDFRRQYEHAIEHTDYQVVVDIGHKDMPVWIVGSRPCISLRSTGWFHQPFPKALPIFDGLMVTDDGGHDIACILPSIRQLASCGPEERRARFKEACELVRGTRASVDPIILEMHKNEIDGIFEKEPDDWPIRPPPASYFGAVQDFLSAVGKYFTWDA